MPTAQIVKWGNSLAIRIPKQVAKQAGVEEGDQVNVEASAARSGSVAPNVFLT